jgi:hypothetical protein
MKTAAAAPAMVKSLRHALLRQGDDHKGQYHSG